MNHLKLKALIKEKNIVIPRFLLQEYTKFDLQLNDFVLLLYLLDKDESIFNPDALSKDLHLEMMQVMESISNLSEKNLVNLRTIKNNQGLMEEIIDLDPFWTKMEGYIVDELNEKEVNDLNIHKLIETEFNRRLSNFEHEMIDSWEENNYDKNLIVEAVKEASMNGVTTLRYIDTILSSWKQKGIQKIDDLRKKEQEKPTEKAEIYVGDWLNYDDDDEI